jgi:hypothetical protein
MNCPGSDTIYGMIYARIYDKNLTASAEKYIMLIP